MEVELYSFKLDCEWKLYSQWVLFFLLALGISLLGNVIVLAGPSITETIENDFRTPMSKEVFGPSKKWRTPKKKKNHWRATEEERLKFQKGRIKKKSPPMYGSRTDRENWDPYSYAESKGIHTRPATILKFRF